MAWSLDCILNMCRDSLRNKVQERLVGMLVLESGSLHVLKKMLYIVMDMDHAALHPLTESPQSL